jgi:hypothetical protein
MLFHDGVDLNPVRAGLVGALPHFPFLYCPLEDSLFDLHSNLVKIVAEPIHSFVAV